MQAVDIAGVHGQLVHRRTLLGAFGEGPALQGAGTGVEHVLDIGTSKGGGEWDVKGEVDSRIDTRRRSHRRSTVWPAKGHVGVRSGHPESRRHSFPTMTGLAREVGYLVHDQWGRIHTLTPMISRGKREESWRVGVEGFKGLDRDRNGAVWAFREWWKRRSIDEGNGPTHRARIRTRLGLN